MSTQGECDQERFEHGHVEVEVDKKGAEVLTRLNLSLLYHFSNVTLTLWTLLKGILMERDELGEYNSIKANMFLSVPIGGNHTIA